VPPTPPNSPVSYVGLDSGPAPRNSCATDPAGQKK
jgi:hypothetical protein